jgi:hypothetical protein
MAKRKRPEKYAKRAPQRKQRYEGLDEWEIDHGAASQAIRNGKPKPVGWYLREATEILNLLADRFDPGEGAARRLKFVPEPETQSEERGEWDSDHGTVRECIEAGVAEPVGWYLRDLVETLNLLANTLDSAGHTEGWRVEFVRARRGRPKSGSDQMLADGRLKTKIWEEQRRGFKKKEAAVEGLKQKTGQGRSTILRKISRKRSS